MNFDSNKIDNITSTTDMQLKYLKDSIIEIAESLDRVSGKIILTKYEIERKDIMISGL